MAIPEPSGGRRAEMIAGLWPGADEDRLQSRAQEFAAAASQLQVVIGAWEQQSHMMFNDNMWSGSGAGAAQGILEGF